MKKSPLPLIAAFCIATNAAPGQGKFNGYMFGDYYYNVIRDTSYAGTLSSSSASNGAAPGAKTMQAFQLRRIYFAYDNDISEQFAAKFRLEVDQAANASNGKIGSYVKDAFLKWKNIFSGSDLMFGIQPTPAFEISEAAWGYRSLEKTIMDLRGIVPSRDQGISLHGKLVNDGIINYWLMLANNSGNSPETDKYKRYYVHLHIKPSTNLQATVYADYKDAGNVLDASKKPVSNSTMTEALFVGYSEPFAYSFGVEAFLASQSNAYTPPGGSLSSRSARGISLFGSYNLRPELAVVLRYDTYDPNTDGSAKGDGRTYVIAGLSYKADRSVLITPNILYESYQAPAGGPTPDASITARVTFYYAFL